jgi:hypothetical protein
MVECEFAQSLTDYASCAVTNLIVLAFRELYEEFGYWMFDLHLAKNGSTIVGHGNFTVRRDENLVKAWYICGVSSDLQRTSSWRKNLPRGPNDV